MAPARTAHRERRLLIHRGTPLLTPGEFHAPLGARRRALLQSTLHVAVVGFLLCLAAANIAGPRKLERDGRRRALAGTGRLHHGGRDPRGVAGCPPCFAAATCSKRSTAVRSARWRTSPTRCTKRSRAHPSGTRSSGSVIRPLSTSRSDPLPAGSRTRLLPSRSGRDLHPACRYGRSPATPRQPGDPALFLADGRVLRRVLAVVHRTARHPRLVVLLGGRRGDAAAAAALPAFRADVSRASRQLDANRSRAIAAAAPVPARRAAWRGPRCGASSEVTASVLSGIIPLLERIEILYLALSLVVGPGPDEPGAPARAGR